MKRIITVVTCFVMAAAISLTASAAGLDANKQKVLDALKKAITVNGQKVELPADVLTQAENYLRQDNVTITTEQANNVVTKVDQAVQVVKDSGKANISQLANTEKTAILSKIQEAATVVNLTASLDSSKNEIVILSAGKKVASSETVLKVTGPDTSALIVVTCIGLVMVAGCFAVAHKAKFFSK